ncbi:TIGR03086 family protein [Streptomyces sp. N2-109]|uniref:TIGR03086 family protein n=1 Tax=Streptomyces gossypii TaxID=2883101 RepID=A0ABT2JYQ3_9ACTN|nr:TIGR03086 family metal-binding protein [Streptomyces gossypii]MCT2592579.1 TIGR03086 family protein [Streptomyces gossypii]
MPHPYESGAGTGSVLRGGPNAHFKRELDELIDRQLLPCEPPAAEGHPMDIVELDRIAVRESLRIVSAARAADWDRPTPCREWTLRGLVSHMAGQHRGFAAAARGERADLEVWQDAALGASPGEVYRASAQDALDAFGEPGLLQREFWLPEIRPTGSFPAGTAVGFHFIDYVVHSWDAAAALGRTVDFPENVLEAALRVAAQVPDGESRQTPGTAFAPSLPVAADAPLLDRTLALLGRDPGWAPARRPAEQRR